MARWFVMRRACTWHDCFLAVFIYLCIYIHTHLRNCAQTWGRGTLGETFLRHDPAGITACAELSSPCCHLPTLPPDVQEQSREEAQPHNSPGRVGDPSSNMKHRHKQHQTLSSLFCWLALFHRTPKLWPSPWLSPPATSSWTLYHAPRVTHLQVLHQHISLILHEA